MKIDSYLASPKLQYELFFLSIDNSSSFQNVSKDLRLPGFIFRAVITRTLQTEGERSAEFSLASLPPLAGMKLNTKSRTEGGVKPKVFYSPFKLFSETKQSTQTAGNVFVLY